MSATYKDIGVSSEGHVGIVEIQRPPHNFFDNSLINQIADAFEAFDRDIEHPRLCAVRPGQVVLRRRRLRQPAADRRGRERQASLQGGDPPVPRQEAQRRGGAGRGDRRRPRPRRDADFRVTCAEARFAANFTRLGFHPGFSLTFTLPRLVGQQKANLMFYTGRRIGGEEAVAMGLADVLVPLADVRKAAIALATEIAESAPLAVLSTRETMRRGFADGAEAATERELTEQDWTRKTEDFKEGIKSYAEKRPGNFKGR